MRWSHETDELPIFFIYLNSNNLRAEGYNRGLPKTPQKAKDKIAKQKSLMTHYSKGNIELGLYQLQMGVLGLFDN